MKRVMFSIFLMSAIGLISLSINDTAKGENWKRFFKDEDGVWYYDKDSIHYPYNTRGFLGSIKTDKNVVRVWIKNGKNEEWIVLEQVWCSQREIEPIDSRNIRELDLERFRVSKFIPPPYNPFKERIIPGSWEEKLYNEVCK